ncbi:FemAB family protein [Pseudogemmobacter sp. W21_MBD1_M6]|uniref:FemAB family protein n=1 Tax=Pseudogemmobacter sp. W21_MBD1_M6 TaxID=3240271 RepID=UPI003F97D1E8
MPDMTQYEGAITYALTKSGLDAVLRTDAPESWAAVWAALPYRPVLGGAASLDYQYAYFRGAGWSMADISLVLKLDGKPCGLWPLSLGGPAGNIHLSSVGAPVAPPVFVSGLSPKSIKRIISKAILMLKQLGLLIENPLVMAEEFHPPAPDQFGATLWHQQLLANGATVGLKHDLYVELGPDLADIRLNFRKSYRPLINAGLREWSVFKMDQTNASTDVWHAFRQAHFEAAGGRATRAEATWDLQYQMVLSGDAFLVGLRNPSDQRFVGGGFFQFTRDEGVYAVGAYDRTLFDKPLGHVVQMTAIEEMKARGIRIYRIGERAFPQDIPAQTDKEVAIGFFKEGFASHMTCRTVFTLPVVI